jgi:hypothetical protein
VSEVPSGSRAEPSLEKHVDAATPIINERPVLFLDVDGVLNPWRASNLRGDWRKIQVGGVRLWMSRELGEWFSRLAERGVRVVWATTWIKYPDDLEFYAEQMGMPGGLERIDIDTDHEEWSDVSNSGKRPGVEAWLDAQPAPPRSIVWVDDDLGPSDLGLAHRRRIAAFAPSPSRGLADSRLRELIETALFGLPDHPDNP